MSCVRLFPVTFVTLQTYRWRKTFVCNLLIILCICRGDRSNSSANSSIVKPSINRRCRIFRSFSECTHSSMICCISLLVSLSHRDLNLLVLAVDRCPLRYIICGRGRRQHFCRGITAVCKPRSKRADAVRLDRNAIPIRIKYDL